MTKIGGNFKIYVEKVELEKQEVGMNVFEIHTHEGSLNSSWNMCGM